MAYLKTPYLSRVKWRDGTAAYCRGCDDKVPLIAGDGVLSCAAGHRQHPLNALANGTGFED